jgi:hypothetical protein
VPRPGGRGAVSHLPMDKAREQRNRILFQGSRPGGKFDDIEPSLAALHAADLRLRPFQALGQCLLGKLGSLSSAYQDGDERAMACAAQAFRHGRFHMMRQPAR